MGQFDRNVLVVDDDPSVRRLFRKLLACDYNVQEAATGEEAVEIVASWTPDLVLLDIMMPGMNGYEVCGRIKSVLDPEPQVVMVSARSTSSERTRAFEMGADDYLVKPVKPAELRSRIKLHVNLLESRAITTSLQREIDDHHAAMRRESDQRLRQVLAIQDVAVFTLAKVAQSRDHETGVHLTRLREYAQILARELSVQGPYCRLIDDSFLDDLYRSSPLHDIGKVGIPDSILLKPGRFTDEEFEIMKRHTVLGGNILHEAVMQSQGGGFLTMAAIIAQYHHERWDGSGYSARLAGHEIPLPARIVAVADVFDALTSERPYKEAWSTDQTREMIISQSGSHFDPAIVEAFERTYDQFLHVFVLHANRDKTVTGAMSFQEQEIQIEPRAL
jgi:cyclic di-GMP phosphodiesterase